MLLESPAHALLSVLRCPSCRAIAWRSETDGITCRGCGGRHRIDRGVLHITLPDEHPEVVQERASVPATESVSELGGWSNETYAPDTDPESSLGQAYLSLPYGDGSFHFEQPGYFQNVRRFAPEFDLLLRRLPPSGVALDIGADGTWSTARLARHGLTAIALDITDHLLLSRLFQRTSPPYALVNVDMHAPVFADAVFDVVTACNALHHSKRLDGLAANIARMLKPGGMLAFYEPYIQNADQAVAFGEPQTAFGINENVHSLERWHDAMTSAGLTIELFALSDAFTAIYRKPARWSYVDPESTLFDHYYESSLTVSPDRTVMAAGVPTAFTVHVEGYGQGAWASRGPQPIRVSYHLSRIAADGPVMVAFDNDRTLLGDFAGPGQPASVPVPVTIAEPGEYQIEFDLVHEGHFWFAQRGGRTALAHVLVR